MPVISNPPYNLRWNAYDADCMESRFREFEVPPESNANYAFILTALDTADRSVMILPQGICTASSKEETAIRQTLIERRYIDAVIACPDRMFESTSIAVVILVLDKTKKDETVEMIDLRKKAHTEIREQCGQYGGSRHTNRVYKKEVNVFSDELITDVLIHIHARDSIAGYCAPATIADIQTQQYKLSPSLYIEPEEQPTRHREYRDIVADINRVIMDKNRCRLTINESLARKIGFDVELLENNKSSMDEVNKLLKRIGADEIIRNDYFRTSKNKNEIRFENAVKEGLSSILVMTLNMWKQHIYYLNDEENRYLAELRNAVLPDLMSGKIELEDEE